MEDDNPKAHEKAMEMNGVGKDAVAAPANEKLKNVDQEEGVRAR